MSRSRASRATAHNIALGPQPDHADARAAVVVEARLERARHQPLRADGAVFGGEVQRETHGFHLAQENEVLRTAAAVEQLGARGEAARCRELALHVERRQTDAAGYQKVDRVCARLGEIGAQRTQHIDLGPGERTLQQSCPRPTVLANTSAVPPADRPTSARTRGAAGIASPSSSNHYELSGLCGGKRGAVRQPKHEVPAAQNPILCNPGLEVAHALLGVFVPRSVLDFLLNLAGLVDLC